MLNEMHLTVFGTLRTFFLQMNVHDTNCIHTMAIQLHTFDFTVIVSTTSYCKLNSLTSKVVQKMSEYRFNGYLTRIVESSDLL